ncbi:MAG: hypothetical protein L6R39_006076 [Caloplaca ligustica]|nr:MAG: hypothetical protein L6R39_006076 [Caloplaca ligustica]
MSSFLFSATEAHICLRCHLRLAAGQARSHRLSRSSPKKSQSRRFAVGQQRLQEHARLDDYDANEQTQFEPPDNFPASGSYEEDDIQLPNDVTQTKAAAADEGFYFRRANLYSRYSLGVTTLGRPAEVLRVHDAPPKDPFERRWWLFQSNDDESPSSTQRLTSSDILDSVALERGLVSAVRAREHIEALKQDWLSGRKEPEQPPSKSECYELGRKLHDGFTIKQLLDYLNEADVPESTELTDLHKPFQSALLTRTEWRAGTTAFPGAAVQIPQSLVTDSRDGPLAKNNYTESTLSYEATRLKEPMKYILVDKIMRRCWNIRPREELESVGEVDFRMPETHLKLLTDYRTAFAALETGLY